MKYVLLLTCLLSLTRCTTIEYVYVEPTLEGYEEMYPQFNREPMKPADGRPDPYTMIGHTCTTMPRRTLSGVSDGYQTECQ